MPSTPRSRKWCFILKFSDYSLICICYIVICAARQLVSCLLYFLPSWKPEFHDRLHKSLPLESIQSHIYLVYISGSISPISFLMSSCHVSTSKNWFLPVMFSDKNAVCIFHFPHAFYISHQSQILLILTILALRMVGKKSVRVDRSTAILCGSLSRRHGAPCDCGWRRRPPDVENCCDCFE